MKKVSEYTKDELVTAIKSVRVESVWSRMSETLVNGLGEEKTIPGHIGMILQWSAEGIGFGELTFTFDYDGGVECDTECMGRDFVEAVLVKLAQVTVIK